MQNVWLVKRTFWGKHEWKWLFNTISHKGRIWCKHCRSQVSMVPPQSQFARQRSRRMPTRASRELASHLSPGNFTSSTKPISFLPVIIGKRAPCASCARARSSLLISWWHRFAFHPMTQRTNLGPENPLCAE